MRLFPVVHHQWAFERCITRGLISLCPAVTGPTEVTTPVMLCDGTDELSTVATEVVPRARGGKEETTTSGGAAVGCELANGKRRWTPKRQYCVNARWKGGRDPSRHGVDSGRRRRNI